MQSARAQQAGRHTATCPPSAGGGAGEEGGGEGGGSDGGGDEGGGCKRGGAVIEGLPISFC